jgi:hypothetical protein
MLLTDRIRARHASILPHGRSCFRNGRADCGVPGMRAERHDRAIPRSSSGLTAILPCRVTTRQCSLSSAAQASPTPRLIQLTTTSHRPRFVSASQYWPLRNFRHRDDDRKSDRKIFNCMGAFLPSVRRLSASASVPLSPLHVECAECRRRGPHPRRGGYGETSSSIRLRVTVPNCAMIAARTRKPQINSMARSTPSSGMSGAMSKTPMPPPRCPTPSTRAKPVVLARVGKFSVVQL